MTLSRGQLRKNLVDHFVNYYAELRRELPDHASALDQVPHFLRGHGRAITVTECADGYVITHRARPEESSAGAPETFELDRSCRNRTVGEVTGRGYPPYSDFDEGETPLVREVRTGRYAKPEGFESRDYISNGRADRLTAEAGRTEARRVLREFFKQNPVRKNER